MKKLLLLVFAVLLISVAAAAEFDNVKTFDADTNTITVKNWFNLGETLTTARLNSNTDTCGTSCSAEKEITIFKPGVLINEVRFYDVTDGSPELGSVKSYQLSYWGDVPTYKYQCRDVFIFPNGTVDQDCNRQQTGTEKGWVSFTEGDTLSAATYTVKLEGSKSPSKAYDWQINLQGRWSTEWAVWGNISLGDTAEVVLNNPVDGERSFTSFNVTFNATANVTTGETVQNMSLYTNLSGVWARNATALVSTVTGDLWVSGFTDAGGSNTTLIQGVKFTAFADTLLINGTKHSTASFETTCALYIHGNISNIQNATYTGDVCTFSPPVEIDNGQTYILASHAGATSRPQTRDASPGYPILSGSSTINASTGWSSNIGDDPIGFYITDMGFRQDVGPTSKGQLFFAISPFGTTLWNVEACDNSSECGFAPANFTYNIGLIENSQTFNASTVEGTTENFIINISVPSGSQVSIANLFYDGTPFGGSISPQANDIVLLSRSIGIPDVPADTNITFFWQIGIQGGLVTNSSSNNQSVTALAIDNCSSFGALILNYTLRDEDTQLIINESFQNSTIELDINISTLAGELIVNFSQLYDEVNPAQVCLNIFPTDFRLDAQARYTADDYVTEFNNIRNGSLTNATIPQNINLLVLLATQSTEFLITFKDQEFLPVANALIDITRKYVSEGVFKTVEIPKTDTNGQTIAHFDLDNVIYTIIVSKEGSILATFANVAVVCEDETIGDCKLNLNALATGPAFSNFNQTGGLSFVMSFNRSARTISTVFSTVGAGVQTVQLNGTKFDRFGNTSVCSNTLTSSSGTLTCVIPGVEGNLTVVAELFTNGQLVTTNYYTIQISARDVFGGSGYFLLFFLMLTIPLLFATSTIGVVIGVILGLIFAILLNIYSGGSIIGQSSAVIWVVVAGGIIIWKIMTRE